MKMKSIFMAFGLMVFFCLPAQADNPFATHYGYFGTHRPGTGGGANPYYHQGGFDAVGDGVPAHCKESQIKVEGVCAAKTAHNILKAEIHNELRTCLKNQAYE